MSKLLDSSNVLRESHRSAPKDHRRRLSYCLRRGVTLKTRALSFVQSFSQSLGYPTSDTCLCFLTRFASRHTHFIDLYPLPAQKICSPHLYATSGRWDTVCQSCFKESDTPRHRLGFQPCFLYIAHNIHEPPSPAQRLNPQATPFAACLYPSLESWLDTLHIASHVRWRGSRAWRCRMNRCKV